ncbi:MAG: hypothetical protein ACRDMY_00225 [Gaiellaceae bacterium]
MAGRLADEEDSRAAALFEVADEPRSAEPGAGPLTVEVERRPDPRGREIGDEELAPHRAA